jgi:hypothetical protein
VIDQGQGAGRLKLMPHKQPEDRISTMTSGVFIGSAKAFVALHQINEGTFPSLAMLMRDIADQVTRYGSLAKFPAEAVANTRNDVYLASEAVRILMKDKESDLNGQKSRHSTPIRARSTTRPSPFGGSIPLIKLAAGAVRRNRTPVINVRRSSCR